MKVLFFNLGPFISYLITFIRPIQIISLASASGVLKIGNEVACTKTTSRPAHQLAWYRLDMRESGLLSFILMKLQKHDEAVFYLDVM